VKKAYSSSCLVV